MAAQRSTARVAPGAARMVNFRFEFAAAAAAAGSVSQYN
jgi:hypothetical protein